MKTRHIINLALLAFALTAVPNAVEAQTEVVNCCSAKDTLRTKECCCKSCNNMIKKNDTKYMNLVTLSIQALLASETPLTDIVDTENGVYKAYDGTHIKDHNWEKGGYGKLSYVEGFKLRSDIACLKALEKAYGRKEALSIYRYFRQAE